ncbi:MAG: 30S ribosomal protein S20 [Phycisphaerae bacterium]
MANSTSAKKRIKQNLRDRERNRARKSLVKTETRKFLDALHRGDLQSAQETFARVQTKLDQVAVKGTLHQNTVARRKSRLARRLNIALEAAAGNSESRIAN